MAITLKYYSDLAGTVEAKPGDLVARIVQSDGTYLLSEFVSQRPRMREDGSVWIESDSCDEMRVYGPLNMRLHDSAPTPTPFQPIPSHATKQKLKASTKLP